VTVVEQVPTGVHLSDANRRYLETKARRGQHTLDLEDVLRSRSSNALP
jgi:GTP cyclohydrolase II